MPLSSSCDDMISSIQIPRHWLRVDMHDIRLEIEWFLACSDNVISYEGEFNLFLHRAMQNRMIFFDTFSVSLIEIRSTDVYHPTMCRGWTPIERSRVVRRPGRYAEVRWQALLLPKLGERDLEWQAIEI